MKKHEKNENFQKMRIFQYYDFYEDNAYFFLSPSDKYFLIINSHKVLAPSGQFLEQNHGFTVRKSGDIWDFPKSRQL